MPSSAISSRLTHRPSRHQRRCAARPGASTNSRCNWRALICCPCTEARSAENACAIRSLADTCSARTSPCGRETEATSVIPSQRGVPRPAKIVRPSRVRICKHSVCARAGHAACTCKDISLCHRRNRTACMSRPASNRRPTATTIMATIRSTITFRGVWRKKANGARINAIPSIHRPMRHSRGASPAQYWRSTEHGARIGHHSPPRDFGAGFISAARSEYATRGRPPVSST